MLPNNNPEDLHEDDTTDNILPSVSTIPDNRQGTIPIVSTFQPSEIEDTELGVLVRSLNPRQCDAFEILLNWCRQKVKSLNSEKLTSVDPVCLFITGGAGDGKSHLIKTIYHTATKTFKYGPEDSNKPTVLLLAPAGIAAINIDGNTINSGLAISKNIFGDHLGPLFDERKTSLRIKLSRLKLIIIDEVSMVSNMLLKYIHDRLKEIFCTPDNVWFGGISIIVVGDFYQLPPVRARPIFSPFKNALFNLSHPWHQFKMIELIEIMLQKDDISFTKMLNRIRLSEFTDNDEEKLSERAIDKNNKNYPHDALHIWAENKPVDEYNEAKLDMIENPLVTLIAHSLHMMSIQQQHLNMTYKKHSVKRGVKLVVLITK